MAIVSTYYHPVVGGVETNARQIATNLVQRGFEVRILTRRTPADAPVDERIDGIPVSRLRPSGDRNTLGKWLLGPSLMQALWRSRGGMDLVFCIDYRGLGVAAIAAARAIGVPVVLQAETPGALSGDQWNGAFSRVRLSPGGRVARLLKTPTRRIYGSADAQVCIAHEFVGEAQRCGIAASRVHYIPHGIDLARFSPVSTDERRQARQQLGWPEDAPVALFVGRLSREKGIIDLLQAWRQVTHPSALLVVVGPEMHGHALDVGPAVRAMAASFADGRVRLHGPADPAPLLAAADVFVQPSHYEAFGQSALEAMSAGLPIVASRVGGLLDFLREGENALLAPPGDVNALGQAIDRLLHDDGLRARFGSRGRELAARDFGNQRVGDRVRRALHAADYRVEAFRTREMTEALAAPVRWKSPDAVRVLPAIFATGFAIWLTPATVHLVNFGTSGGRRVIFVPSIVALVLALLVAAGLVGLLTIIARRASGSSADATRVSAPLNLFWLCVIPFLPGLPDQVPLVLLLAGPVRWAIGITAVGAVLFQFVPVRLRTAAQTIDPRPMWIFAAGLVVALLLGTWVSLTQGVGGDEPHYLVITQSLLGDGDLRIENQHQEEQYRSYFNNVLPMHYLRRGLGGVIYSIHAPGLPALLMPAFAIGGARGAIVFISVVAALTGVAVFLIVRRFSGAPSAVFAWMSLALTTPFIFHSWLIYPETPAACLVAWAALWFVGRERVSWWRWVLRGAAISYWPWLHAKFAVFLAVFGAAFVVQSAKRRDWSAVPALIVPVGASVAGWLGLFSLLYGVADPTIAYGDSAAGDQLNWGNLPRGMLGLLFDQEYGLLLHAPIYLLVPLGLWWMLRSSGLAGLAVLTLALFALFVSSTTRYYMWWGGSSVPARFLVPILPLGAVAIGVAMARLARPLKGVAWLLLFVSVAMTLVMVRQPARYMMFNDRDGTGRIAELIGGSAGLTVVLPSFLWADWTAQLPQLAVCLAGLAGGALAAGLAARTGRTAAVTAVAFALAVLATAGVAARVLVPAHSFASTVAVSRAAMWTDAGKAALHGLDPGRLRYVSIEDAMRRWPIVLRPGAERDRDPLRAFGPVSLPPGSYELRVWWKNGLEPPGAVFAAFQPGNAVLASTTARGNPSRAPFVLPLAFEPPPIWFGAHEAGTLDAIDRLELRPLSLSARPGRQTSGSARTVESIGGRDGAWLVYLDDQSFPEGGVFWTRGGASAAFLVVPGDARRLRVQVQAGAAAGTARVEIGSTRRDLSLAPQEVQVIDVDVANGVSSLPMRVSFPGSFRPRDVNKESTDARLLGCRVSVTPE